MLSNAITIDRTVVRSFDNTLNRLINPRLSSICRLAFARSAADNTFSSIFTASLVGLDDCCVVAIEGFVLSVFADGSDGRADAPVFSPDDDCGVFSV